MGTYGEDSYLDVGARADWNAAHNHSPTTPKSSSMRLSTLPVTLALAAAAFAQDGGIYHASGGIVVIEVESTPPSAGWAVETIDSGYTHDSYYRWDGGDQFANPGMGILEYRIQMESAGNYRFSLRNRHDHPDPTEENDVWAKMNNGNWQKVFSNNVNTVGTWTFESTFDHHPAFPPAAFNMNAGVNVLQLSGRSQNFQIDRFHLHEVGHPDGENPNVPESVALLGENYCGPAVPNSTGNSAEMSAWGSTFRSLNDCLLMGSSMPNGQAMMFVCSETQGAGVTPPGSSGTLCISGSIGRIRTSLQSVSGGTADYQLDLSNVPNGPGFTDIAAGETWYFQAWFRDQGGTTNFTDGLCITFQ